MTRNQFLLLVFGLVLLGVLAVSTYQALAPPTGTSLIEHAERPAVQAVRA